MGEEDEKTPLLEGEGEGEEGPRKRKASSPSASPAQGVGEGGRSPKFGPLPEIRQHRLWTRLVLVVGAMVVVYLTSSNEKLVHYARVKETHEHRRMNVHCHPKLAAELESLPGCLPSSCGRAVMDRLVTPAEADQLVSLAERGLALGGSAGGASILDLHSGALSHGTQFVNIFKTNLDGIFSPQDFAVYKSVRKKIQQGVAWSFGVSPDSLFLTHPTFFSRLDSREPASPHDQYWHRHVDQETYESFHFTSLVYLNDFGSSFKGGRFLFHDPDNVTLVVEPKKGRVLMFTSGAENAHQVERVTSGQRYAITLGFTCLRDKAIPDPEFS